MPTASSRASGLNASGIGPLLAPVEVTPIGVSPPPAATEYIDTVLSAQLVTASSVPSGLNAAIHGSPPVGVVATGASAPPADTVNIDTVAWPWSAVTSSPPSGLNATERGLLPAPVEAVPTCVNAGAADAADAPARNTTPTITPSTHTRNGPAPR